ncbi:hypothetical protein BCR39DRAFT_511224 [Naematelia encephala]|uniref:Ribosomal protein S6 n=1 Tax=Naematelia encephala TaxID=71784 RepID=A0A1Y2BLI4_9TREE|nr:hypothetical protein BCR39DRAFT_511224 [Naematelia encephala]
MPLYELFCIAAHNPVSPSNLRQLISGISREVHNSGGCVRSLQNLGIGLTLPTRKRRHQVWHHRGDHFTMLFDTSPVVLAKLNATMREDPLVVKWMFTKKGEKLKHITPTPPPSIEFDESFS